MSREIIKKGSLIVARGLYVFPAYLHYWGLKRAVKRVVKALVLPSFGALATELVQFRDFFRARIRPKTTPTYVVVAPDYVSNSAGIGCLYQLAHDLRSNGFEAAITGSQAGHPAYPVPLLSKAEAMRAARAGAWVIYPETTMGNPLRAKHVVRWVLNRPGLLGGASVYPESEHVFVYSDVFAPYVRNIIRGKLYMPTLDRSIFFRPPKENPRTLECYYVGKSTYKEGHFNPDLTLEITRNTPPKSELGKIFRSAKVLYCFDNSTALTYEAIICGCPVVIIPDGTQTWEDYKQLELGTAGMSWGKPEGEPELGDIDQLEQKFLKREEDYKHHLDFLITYTQGIHKTPRISAATQYSVPAAKTPVAARPEIPVSRVRTEPPGVTL